MAAAEVEGIGLLLAEALPLPLAVDAPAKELLPLANELPLAEELPLAKGLPLANKLPLAKGLSLAKGLLLAALLAVAVSPPLAVEVGRSRLCALLWLAAPDPLLLLLALKCPDPALLAVRDVLEVALREGEGEGPLDPDPAAVAEPLPDLLLHLLALPLPLAPADLAALLETLGVLLALPDLVGAGVALGSRAAPPVHSAGRVQGRGCAPPPVQYRLGAQGTPEALGEARGQKLPGGAAQGPLQAGVVLVLAPLSKRPAAQGVCVPCAHQWPGAQPLHVALRTA